jgi:hypothetical protein
MVEGVFYGLLAVVLLAAFKPKHCGLGPLSSKTAGVPRLPWSRWQWWIYVAFGLVVLTSLAILGFGLARNPHGEIDAWQIWNLHARLLVRGGEEWHERLVQMEDWSHPDYPLLLPATVARGWVCAGNETTEVPRLMAGLFALATVGLLTAGLAVLRTPVPGLLGGITLLATPGYLPLAVAQYADVPLGFYFLAGVLLFEAQDRLGCATIRLPFLAGLVAGMAAWTKNEGQLYIVAMLLGRLVVGWAGRSGIRPLLRELAAFAAGLGPFMGVLAYFKLRMAGPNDLIAGQAEGALLKRILDGKRYWQVVYGMVVEFGRVVGWWVMILGLFAALLGVARVPWQKRLHTLAVLVFMLVGYALVYLATPLDLVEHIRLSADRLCLQLWPCALLWFFLNVASPEC